MSEQQIEQWYLIDVRSLEEFEQKHLSSATWIEYHSIFRLADYVTDLNAGIALYCHSGVRSEWAMRCLQRMGYHNAINLGSYAEAERWYEQHKCYPRLNIH